MGSGISCELPSEEVAFTIIDATGTALQELMLQQNCSDQICERMIREKRSEMCQHFSPGQLAWTSQKLGLRPECTSENMALAIANYYLGRQDCFCEKTYNPRCPETKDNPEIRCRTTREQCYSPKPRSKLCYEARSKACYEPSYDSCYEPCYSPTPKCEPCRESNREFDNDLYCGKIYESNPEITIQMPSPIVYSPKPVVQKPSQPVIPVHTVQGTPNIEPKRYRVTGQEITRTPTGVRVRQPQKVQVTQTIPQSQLDDFSKKLGKQTKITNIVQQSARQNIPRGTPVRALADHTPTTLSELPLRKGQLTKYLEPGPRDWALVTHGGGSTGYVPGSHLSL